MSAWPHKVTNAKEPGGITQGAHFNVCSYSLNPHLSTNSMPLTGAVHHDEQEENIGRVYP